MFRKHQDFFVWNRDKQHTEHIYVFSCIIVDQAGPIQVDLWRDAVNDLQRIFGDDMETPMPKLLTFDRLAPCQMSSKDRLCVPELNKVP